MAIDQKTVQIGMDVVDPTGEKIGKIDDILDVQAYVSSESDSTSLDPSSGTVADLAVTTVTPAPSEEQTYLKVSEGGILGIGAKDLYIPFSSIRNVTPGENVTIDCTKDTCGDMYGTKPDFLP